LGDVERAVDGLKECGFDVASGVGGVASGVHIGEDEGEGDGTDLTGLGARELATAARREREAREELLSGTGLLLLEARRGAFTDIDSST
jgi:hypothetical protein